MHLIWIEEKEHGLDLSLEKIQSVMTLKTHKNGYGQESQQRQASPQQYTNKKVVIT